jgi:uncharacterized protein (TIGR00369 family)
MYDNPERILAARAVAEGLTDVPVDTNPAFRDLGTRLLRADRDGVVMSFDLGERFVQGNGVVHGGTLSAALDSAMAFAVIATLAPGEWTATASMTVNFFASVAPGPCRVEATVEKRGRSLAFTRAALHDTDGRTAAVATATFALLRPGRPADAAN